MSEAETQHTELSEALALAQRFQKRQFAITLRRLATAMKERGRAAFTEDDINTFTESFGFTASELDALFSGAQFILQQAAAFGFNSERIERYALEAGASEDVANCFAAVWDAEGDDLLDCLKGRTVTGSVLDHTDWRLGIAAANSKGAMRKPVMVIDLNLKEGDPIAIQFDHKQLSDFFGQIEQIQQKIDALT